MRFVFDCGFLYTVCAWGLVSGVGERSGQSLHCRFMAYTTVNRMAGVHSIDSMYSPINSKIHLVPAHC